jgi:hypothetical protein
MFRKHSVVWQAVSVLVAVAVAPTAYAQVIGPRPLTRDEIAKQVGASLPPIILPDGNSDLVMRLFSAKLGTPLSKSFNPAKAASDPAIFGRLPPAYAPDCQRFGTPTGDADQGDCRASRGDASGKGPYTLLSFSKNLGVGNIKFLKRAQEVDLDPSTLKSVTLPDADAYDHALKFLGGTFGVPLNEIPVPPAATPTNALRVQNPIPVSSLTIGFSPEANLKPVTIQKVVTIQRGLFVGIADPAGGPGLPYVPAPGKATVLLDDSGIQGALVSDWQELRRPPDADLFAKNAKTRQQLIDEISDDLFTEAPESIAIIAVLVGLASDWRGTFGYLVPAIQVFVAPLSGDLTPDELQKLIANQGPSTGGFVRQYPLYHGAPGSNLQR